MLNDYAEMVAVFNRYRDAATEWAPAHITSLPAVELCKYVNPVLPVGTILKLALPPEGSPMALGILCADGMIVIRPDLINGKYEYRVFGPTWLVYELLKGGTLDLAWMRILLGDNPHGNIGVLLQQGGFGE